MLDIAKLGARSPWYYLREVAESREAYYSGHGEAPGEWLGSASAALGLDGIVGEAEFLAMFAGRDPVTGELLGKEHRKDGLPAFDLVFRPVKSVSILYGVSSPEVRAAVAQAHANAVRYAADYLERETGTRRGRNGVHRIAGRGLLAAAYTHRQSRANDPLLHTHLIVANRIQGEDGRWTTIDGRDLYYQAIAADALYTAAYQHELTRTLGLAWGEANERGDREVVGVPPELIRHFSKRREDIELADESRAEAGESSGPKVRNWLAHATRPDKEHLAAVTLYERWSAAVADQGIEPAALQARSVGQAAAGVGMVKTERVLAGLASPEGLTERASTFTRRDVIAGLRGKLTGLSPVEHEQVVDEFLAGERVVRVLVGDRQRYTTPEMLACEERLLASAVERAAEDVAVAQADAVRAAVAESRSLGEDQAAMVRTLASDGQGVSIGVGRAGTGKTFTMKAARRAWELSGVRVIGCAPTGIAAVELEQGSGIESMTVDALLAALDGQPTRDRMEARAQARLEALIQHAPGEDARAKLERVAQARAQAAERARLPRGGVLVVDEAGMVGTRKLDRLLFQARVNGTKVVLLGDDRQLQAVDAGGGFRALRQRLGAAELTVNRRQRDPLDREALELIRAERGPDAFRTYAEGGRVTILEGEGELERTLLGDWWASYGRGERAVMLTLRRSDADALNDAARQVMRADGRLGETSFQVGDREFSTGDFVVCRRNNPRLGVANGTRGTVVGFDQRTRTMTIQLQGSEPAEVTLTAAYLAKDGAGGGPAVNHAYATTTHKTQAMTVDKAFVLAGPGLTSEWSYVAMSRVRQRAQLYALQERPGADRGEVELPAAIAEDVAQQVAAGMGRSTAEVLAVDQAHQAQATRPLREFSMRELREQRDQLAATLGQAPASHAAALTQSEQARERAEAALAEAETAHQAALADREQYTGRQGLRHPRQAADARQAVERAALAAQRARQAADEAGRRELAARQLEQQRTAWLERHRPVQDAHKAVAEELAHRRRLGARLLELDPPGYLVAELGRPGQDLTPDQRAGWRTAAQAVEDYRGRYDVQDQDRALGEPPKDLAQRAAYRRTREAIDKALGRERERDKARAQGRERGRDLDVG
jgi:conjugative relaxase-like TrwC/TraI family protein